MADAKDERPGSLKLKAKACSKCSKSFGKFTHRPKKCKVCGEAVCVSCASRKVVFGHIPKPVRVCNSCYDRVVHDDDHSIMKLPISTVKVNGVGVGKFMLSVDLGIYDPARGPISLTMINGEQVEIVHPIVKGVRSYSEWVSIHSGRHEARFVCETTMGIDGVIKRSVVVISIVIFLAGAAVLGCGIYFANGYASAVGIAILAWWMSNQFSSDGKFTKVMQPHHCSICVRSRESDFDKRTMFVNQGVDLKTIEKWSFGRVHDCEITDTMIPQIKVDFNGDWELAKHRMSTGSMAPVMAATDIPESMHQSLLDQDCKKKYEFSGDSTMTCTTTVVGGKRHLDPKTDTYELDGLIRFDVHPFSRCEIMVRHFMEGKDFVTQAVYCDTGNSQEIRRTVIDGGRILLVTNSVTRKDNAEVAAATKYYSRISS